MKQVKDSLVEALESFETVQVEGMEEGDNPTLPYVSSMNVPISEKEEQEDE